MLDYKAKTAKCEKKISELEDAISELTSSYLCIQYVIIHTYIHTGDKKVLDYEAKTAKYEKKISELTSCIQYVIIYIYIYAYIHTRRRKEGVRLRGKDC